MGVWDRVDKGLRAAEVPGPTGWIPPGPGMREVAKSVTGRTCRLMASRGQHTQHACGVSPPDRVILAGLCARPSWAHVARWGGGATCMRTTTHGLQTTPCMARCAQHLRRCRFSHHPLAKPLASPCQPPAPACTICELGVHAFALCASVGGAACGSYRCALAASEESKDVHALTLTLTRVRQV